jgi:hypothetical protein
MPNQSLARYGPAAVSRGYNTYQESMDQQRRQFRSDFWKKAVLPVAAMATGGAATAALGGGAAAPAASAGWTMPGVTAPTFGAAATTAATVPSVASVAGAGGLMSRIPWGSVASQGANTLFGIYANRQMSSANRDALAYQERANAEAMAFEREQMAESRRQFDQQQAAAERAHAADERFRGEQFASTEEERLYRRRLEDEREARRAPYRQASLEALGRLPGVLASGRTSPGSLGSYRRG